MELKQRLDPKYIFIGLYVVIFLLYVIIGLQPAKAKTYAVSGRLEIPSIGLVSDITDTGLVDGALETPESIVGSYLENTNKTFLYGHSSTVFNGLHHIKINDTINVNGTSYKVVDSAILPKSAISMKEILKSETSDTIIIMTCAGDLYSDGDASHRLIITAVIQ